MNSGLFTSISGDWETPRELFKVLDDEFHFTLDACATAETAKCREYLTLETIGSMLPWKGTVFCNPPYGRQIGKWIERAYHESQNGATVVCLLPSRTDTRWWHDYCMKGEIRFIKGRLYFKKNGEGGRAPFPSAVVIFRPTPMTMEV